MLRILCTPYDRTDCSRLGNRNSPTGRLLYTYAWLYTVSTGRVDGLVINAVRQNFTQKLEMNSLREGPGVARVKPPVHWQVPGVLFLHVTH